MKVAWLLIALIVSPTFAFAQAAPTLIPAERHDVSRPVADIPEEAVERAPGFREIPRQPLPRHGVKPHFRDPVLQESLGGLAMPSTSVNFEGVSNVSGVLPPDTNGAVGPNHYVQWVNLAFAIWDKAGNQVKAPVAGSSLWAGFGGPCQTSNDGDPVAVYDHLADRWVLTQFALPNYPSGPFYQCIAVSTTGDPTGTYYRYAFKISDTKLNDYPKLAVWPDGYYMTFNQFSGNSWAGQGVAAFDRNKMLQGLAAGMVYFDLFATDANLGGMLPSSLDGPAPPAGTPNYFVQVDDDAWGYSPDQLQMWAFHVDWATPVNSTFTPVTTLPTAAFDSNMCGYSGNCIPQNVKPLRKLDALSDRLMYRLQFRQLADRAAMVVNHTVDVNGFDHAGIRWYELRNTGGGWSIYQQGTYAPDASHRWMGSIAMDQAGNIALGYSVSSATSFPSIRYTGRLAGDPLGTLPQGETTLIAGGGGQTHSSGRWGDYSAMTVDPTDGCTFWYTQEYYAATSIASWRTRIGSFKFPSCASAPVAPAAPTNLAASPGDSQVALSWNAAAGATSYNVLRSTTSGAEALVASGVTATSYTDTNLTNGTTYFYVVQAANAGGTSGNSNEVSATPSCQTPGVPGGLAATPGNNQVSLSWSAVAGASAYNVKRSTVSGGPYATIAGGVTATSYLDTTASNGTTYFYVVSAVNSCGGQSADSAEVSATPAGATVPAAPTGLTATQGPGAKKISLSWTASTGATSYTVSRSTTSEGPYTNVATTTGTTFADTGLPNGTTFYYVVTAVNSAGASPPSSPASATTR
ncbi:MAG TPA: fibronectin type III domain-containing protein [Vicinamibacterales bacterium]|nr:fibronectin type III domain-containing protein [Vicinamibacterales bacterium]